VLYHHFARFMPSLVTFEFIDWKYIYHLSNTYIIHVDSKSLDKDDVIALVSSMPNVGVMPKSFDVTWGGISMVYAELEGIFTLLDVDPYWDFVINLSSADYPLCTQEELMNYLHNHGNNNFDNGRVPLSAEEHYWYVNVVL
jgi:protein xylosyltransferase